MKILGYFEKFCVIIYEKAHKVSSTEMFWFKKKVWKVQLNCSRITSLKSKEIELMQYRKPVGLGPSSNTCPK